MPTRKLALVQTILILLTVGIFLWSSENPKVTEGTFIVLAILFSVVWLWSVFSTRGKVWTFLRFVLSSDGKVQWSQEEISAKAKRDGAFVICTLGFICCAIYLFLLTTHVSPFRTTVGSTDRVHLVVGGKLGEQLPPGNYEIKWGESGRFWRRKVKEPIPFLGLLPVAKHENLHFLMKVESNELSAQEEFEGEEFDRLAYDGCDCTSVQWDEVAYYAMAQCEDFSPQGIETAIRSWIEKYRANTHPPYSIAYTITVPSVVKWDDWGVTEVIKGRTF